MKSNHHNINLEYKVHIPRKFLRLILRYRSRQDNSVFTMNLFHKNHLLGNQIIRVRLNQHYNSSQRYKVPLELIYQVQRSSYLLYMLCTSFMKLT